MSCLCCRRPGRSSTCRETARGQCWCWWSAALGSTFHCGVSVKAQAMCDQARGKSRRQSCGRALCRVLPQQKRGTRVLYLQLWQSGTNWACLSNSTSYSRRSVGSNAIISALCWLSFVHTVYYVLATFLRTEPAANGQPCAGLYSRCWHPSGAASLACVCCCRCTPAASTAAARKYGGQAEDFVAGKAGVW
jgi:hypothetical protein